MAAHIFLANPKDLSRPAEDSDNFFLEDDGYYWFLYRYFEGANLNAHKGELIDLYGGAIIEGYQLHRLQTELEEALRVTRLMSDRWKVLVGWKSENRSKDNEHWKEVEKSEMVELIERLLRLISRSNSSELKLVSSGD